MNFVKTKNYNTRKEDPNQFSKCFSRFINAVCKKVQTKVGPLAAQSVLKKLLKGDSGEALFNRLERKFVVSYEPNST